jgi:RNA polymerase sigma-32 factor
MTSDQVGSAVIDTLVSNTTSTKSAPKSLSDRALIPVSNALIQLSSYEDSLDAYLHKIAQIPLLSREDEVEYARRYRDHNDMQAAQYLVLSNLRFVVYVAKGFKGYGLPMADLVQEGNVGLMKAVERFDPDQNVRFISYAVYWIRCDINEYIIKNMRMVKTITSKNRRKLLFNLAKHLHSSQPLSVGKRQSLAEQYGVSLQDVETVETALMNHDASVEYTTPEGVSAVEMLPDHSQSPEQDFDSSSRQLQHQDIVNKMLGQLTDRQQEIIRERWLSSAKTSLEELAKKYKVSMQRVSQIEKQALARCKELGFGKDLLFSDS